MQTLSLRSILNYRGSIIKPNSTNYTTCLGSTVEINFWPKNDWNCQKLVQKLKKKSQKISKIDIES